MVEYIKNIIPRIKNYSQKVDKEELLIGKTWVWVGFDQGYTTFHFLRDNRLLISQLGNVQEGKWEFIGNNQLLNVKGEGFNVLLNHGILFEGVLIMQKQGVLDNFEVLYDEQIVKDGDVINYIDAKINPSLKLYSETKPVQKSEFPKTIVINDTELFFEDYPKVGAKIKSSKLFNGKIYKLYRNRGVEIENNEIIKFFSVVELFTDEGVIVLEIESFYENNPTKGTGVFKASNNIPQGEYSIKSIDPDYLKWKRIFFNRGEITRVSYTKQSTALILSFLIIFLIFIVLLKAIFS